jgi:hypothetical protein
MEKTNGEDPNSYQMSQDPLHFSLFPFLPLSKFWKYKCNDVIFGGFNYLIYISKLLKTLVMEIENGKNKLRCSE